MNLSIIARLLFRRSLGIAMGIVLGIGVAMLFAERALRDPAYADIHRALNFTFVYLVATFGCLLSFGSLVGRALEELRHVPLARVVPGLSRRTRHGSMALFPLVAAAATAFDYFAIPGVLAALSAPTLFLLNAVWYCVGLVLGRSWLTVMIVLAAFTHGAKAIGALTHHPGASNVVLLGVVAVLWWLHYSQRYGGEAPLSLLKFPSRDLPARPDAENSAAATLGGSGDKGPTIGKLLLTGIRERFGHRRALVLLPMLVSIVVVHGLFGVIIHAAGRSEASGFGPFIVNVFTDDHPNTKIMFVRLGFAVLVACTGYVFALTYDGSPPTDIWHPVSRRMRRSTVFLSHLGVNALFALVQAAVTIITIYTVATLNGARVGNGVLLQFLMPMAALLILLPIAQTLLPNRSLFAPPSANALRNLGGGALGAAICLLTAYWSNHWPTGTLRAELPRAVQLLLLAVSIALIYAAYFAHLTWYYRRCDLRARSA